jgi:ribonuclease HI
MDSRAASASTTILGWSARGERTADERLLGALASRLLAVEGDGALEDYAVAAVLARAQLGVACGWRAGATMAPPASLSPPSPATSPEGLKPTGGPAAIYCDGSCRSNGRPEARAGWGVYVTDADGRDLHRKSARVPADEPQTNQRAELYALQYAIDYACANGGATIYCDSKYAMDCVGKWATLWAAAGWRKADGKPILHLDLIRPTYERLNAATGIRLVHVPAHTGGTDAVSRGNAVADALATAAAAEN